MNMGQKENTGRLLTQAFFLSFLTSTDLELVVCEQRTKGSFVFVAATFPLIRIVSLSLIKEVVNLSPKNHHHQLFYHQQSGHSSPKIIKKAKEQKNIKHILFLIISTPLISEEGVG